MIEDDLRDLLTDEFDVTVCARLIPKEMTEGIVVQEIGGRPSLAGIRRAYHLISIMGVSLDKDVASVRMRAARDYLTTHIPADIGQVHYYTAKPRADGSLMTKTENGPRYVEFVDIEVGCSI